MKHKIVLAFSSLFVLTLSACGGGSKAKTPTTNYEKVKYAFNGVEKSFKNRKIAKSAYSDKKERIHGNDVDGALRTIYGLYTNSDIKELDLDDLSYNQPPMTQFQCLKKALEKIGEGYSFGTKYYDVINGEIYVDFETGYEDEDKQAANKYNYAFNLGLDININEADLITADVTFDITLTQGSNSYHTNWYVAIELDYDMNDSTPNYSMTMATENDEDNLPYYGHRTYEYDYVEVQDNKIKEWRKFCMDANERLIRDAAHPDAASYYNQEGFVYNVDAFAWLKDGVFYKNNSINSEKKQALFSQLFYGLGINGTDLDSDAFINKAGTKHSTISQIYKDFSKVFGKDVIYDLVTRDKDKKPEEEKRKSSIIILMDDDQTVMANITYPDVTFAEMLTECRDINDDIRRPHLWYVDQFGGLMERVNSIYDLQYVIRFSNYADKETYVDLNMSISQAYINFSIQEGIPVTGIARECELFFNVPFDSLSGSYHFTFGGSFEPEKEGFPESLISFGIPEYESEDAEFDIINDNQQSKIFNVNKTNEDEANAYILKLVKEEGFEYTDRGYKRKLDDILYLYISVDLRDIEKGTVHIDAWLEEEGAPTPTEETLYRFDIIGDFNNWSLESGVIPMVYDEKTDSYNAESVKIGKDTTFIVIANLEYREDGYQYSKAFGYGELQPFAEINEFFTLDNGNMITALKDCVFNLRLQINNDEVALVIMQIQEYDTESAFPTTFVEFGIPAYDSYTAVYEVMTDSETVKEVAINNTSSKEYNNYIINKIQRNNFKRYNDSEVSYMKDMGNGVSLYIDFEISMLQDGHLILTAWKVDEGGQGGEGGEGGEATGVTSVSIVGDFNGWSTTEGCIDFTSDEKSFVIENVHLEEGKIKFVANHTWEIEGGFGYSDVSNIQDYANYFTLDTSDENGNIVILQECYVSFSATVLARTSVHLAITAVTGLN